MVKGKGWSEDEDWFLLIKLVCYGLLIEDCYECIRVDVGKEDLFRFDWFICSRILVEIGRCCIIFLILI